MALSLGILALGLLTVGAWAWARQLVQNRGARLRVEPVSQDFDETVAATNAVLQSRSAAPTGEVCPGRSSPPRRRNAHTESLLMRAYMVSCPSREAVRFQTLANMRATDWAEEPIVVMDRSTSDSHIQREVETGLRLLQDAVSIGVPLILFLEDDLEFNLSLRHNLNCWSTLRQVRAGEHFFGSLYNPQIRALSWQGGARSYIADPASVYGSQAFLFSLATAQFFLAHWDEVAEPIDIRMARLASRVSPIYYHIPLLVQHVGYQSVGDGWYHCAPDFQCDWRAIPEE